MEYSATINRDDWREVLEHAELANVFHTPTYFDAQTSEAVGHELLYLGCYDQGRPVGIIAGCRNTDGYHRGLIEIGTKSGGYPLMVDEYDQRPDADRLKNDFLTEFANRYLQDAAFLAYPCFHMQSCVFEDAAWGCIKQFDTAAFLDLQQDEDRLWKNLRDKGRNMVRAGRRKGVTVRIANELRYFDQFYAQYKALRTRLKTGYIGYDELRLKFEMFTQQELADFWVAFLDETPIAFNFMWTYKQHVNYVYNSSHPGYLKYNPNNVLQWEMIRHYKERGCTLYNLWGVRNMNLSEPDALRPDRPIEGYGKFKLSLGAEARDLVRYVKLNAERE